LEEEKINLIRIYPEATKTPDIVLIKLASEVPLSTYPKIGYKLKSFANMPQSPKTTEARPINSK
tara:strand:+ start:269 stop:460 length:192 start_codon:yes stop_codon:yes gene_type:complete